MVGANFFNFFLLRHSISYEKLCWKYFYLASGHSTITRLKDYINKQLLFNKESFDLYSTWVILKNIGSMIYYPRRGDDGAIIQVYIYTIYDFLLFYNGATIISAKRVLKHLIRIRTK